MSFLNRFNRKTADGAQPGHVDEPTAPVRQPASDAVPAAAATHEILLDLGDFLPQIPPELIRAGPHPAEARLKFDMADLADRIAGGQTSIRLAEIHRQVPEMFASEAAPSEDIEIPFPWDKVMKMLADARTTAATPPKAGGPTPGGAESSSNRRAILPVGTALHPALLHDEKLTREELLRACGALWTDLERVQGEHERQVAALAAESGRREQKLTEERDALSQQLAELPKHGPGAEPKQEAPPPAVSPVVLGRSPKEHQRQVDELQRRISALESHQREAAHELSREKESRIKLERQLGSLDRLSRETTKHHEEAAAALKRDFETASRKRDAEAARALREAQEQFESVKAAKARIATELEEARARLAKAPPAGEAWEDRALAQFEADAENYRRRIRELLAERDALAREKEALAAGPSSAAVADEEALRAERTKLSHELEAARLSSNAMITTLRAENKRLTYERDALQKEGETALAEIESKTQAWAGERAALERDLASAREKLEGEKTTLTAQLAQVQAAHAEVTAERNGLDAHTKALQAEITRVRQQHEIAVADLRATLAERQRGGEKQATESATARQEHEQALAAVTGERDAALAALAEERGQIRQGAAEAEQKLSAEVSRLTAALETARRESAGSVQGLAAATAEADRKFDVAQREREALLAERRILAAELESAKAALIRSEEEGAARGEQLVALRAQLEKLRDGQRPAFGDVSPEGRGHGLQPSAEQQASIIDLHEAEILPPPAEEAGWLKIPRIRPVPVPPPQFQNH